MTYWKDSLLTGVENIDNQHRKLVGAIDVLMAACAAGKGRAVLEKTMDYVVSYTKEHFTDEEKIQARYTYPGLAAHKKLHAAFIVDVSVLVSELREAGPSVALTAKINKTLVDWLIRHISVEDKKIGDYIRSK